MDKLSYKLYVVHKFPNKYIQFYVHTCKMNIMKCFTILAVLSAVNSHAVDMVCVPECNSNITANVGFVNEWLNHDSNTSGIHQLRNHKDTVVYRLMEDVDTDVS